MHGFRKIAKDTALMTCAALLMRCVGLFYQSWQAQRIGPAGVGLWQLVVSVNVLSATLAISGIRFTTTRLVSEELGSNANGQAGGIVLHCLLYALIFGCSACLLAFFCAEPAAFLWIGDARAAPCLRTLAFTLPMISLSCVLNGSFIAKGAAWKSAFTQVAEQCVNVGTVMLLLRNERSGDLARICAAIARGSLLADAVSLLLAAVLYLTPPPRRRRIALSAPLTGRMLRIALPLAMSAYARAGLTTLEHLLVPRKLREAGLSTDGALGGYGTVTGMVFPLITFPACLLTAAAELVIPELTAAQVRGDRRSILQTVRRLLRFAAIYALAVALFLFFSADALGALLFHSPDVGRCIRLLSPLVPIMYLDIVTDGCLKGLGQMMRSMYYNIGEAMLGLLLVMTLLPRWAMRGYLAMLFICETWNFALSFTRLRKVAFGAVPRGRTRRFLIFCRSLFVNISQIYRKC